MFDKGKNNYKSDLTLGERYRDKTTGIEGHLVAVYFYEHACERACIRFVNGQGEVVEHVFDAPELVAVSDGRTPRVVKTGGPDRGPTRLAPSRR